MNYEYTFEPKHFVELDPQKSITGRLILWCYSNIIIIIIAVLLSLSDINTQGEKHQNMKIVDVGWSIFISSTFIHVHI